MPRGMFKGSFWYPIPKNPKRLIALLLVLVMIPLHQSELVGLYNSTLILFGWLPAQLAYDLAFGIAGFGILIILYHLMPEPPAEHATATERSPREPEGESPETEQLAVEGK